jgi:hypothetical protein
MSRPEPDEIFSTCADYEQEQAREKEADAGGSSERYGFGAFLLRA